MPNLRYILRLISAFFARFRVLIFASIVIGVIFFFLLRFVYPLMSLDSTRVVGYTGRFTPASLPVPILSLAGEGLTKLDKDGTVVPDLAASWETPDRGKTWIFKLKDGLKWQDGKAVTSSNILYQFSDVTNETPDAKTVVFKLQNPYSAFPSVVSRPVFKKGLLGTGEWRVKKLSLAGTYIDRLVLEKKSGEKNIYKF